MSSRRWFGLLCVLGTACGSPPPASTGPAEARAPAAAAPPATRETSELTLSRKDAEAALCKLLAERDRDCDQRITLEDESAALCSDCSARPAFPYTVELAGRSLELRSRSEAAQLVQELVLGLSARESGAITLDPKLVRENPSDYLALRIQRDFWPALTRRIDPEPAELARALADTKLGENAGPELDFCPAEAARCPAQKAAPAQTERVRHVYVPGSDAQALFVFSKSGVPGSIAVHALPTPPTPEWVNEVTKRGEHGLLTLALDRKGRGVPFVVPGGRFNELYGWDSFFIVWGLLAAGDNVALARAMVENQAYELRHYGKILNANRTYYLTRSQPPLFTSSLAAVLERLPAAEIKGFLEPALQQALFEYDRVWSAAPHRLDVCDKDTCLARYFDPGTGEPPEVETGHFDWFYQAHALGHGHCPKPRDGTPEALTRFYECSQKLAEDYRSGKLRDREIDAFFENDRCVRESGHDTTYRWFDAGRERCAEHAPVELNAMLFKYEVDLATFIDERLGGEFQGRKSAEFCEHARARARLLQKYTWDEQAGAFFDFDVKKRRPSTYLSAASLVPLWASAPNRCGVSLVTPAMAERLRATALAELEVDGGLSASAASSLARVKPPRALVKAEDGSFSYVENERQWESPNGWAPHQMFAWAGLRNFGFESDARRLAYRWLSTIVSNAADYHGTVPEKFDVVRRSHRVFHEYGNVNTEFSYISTEGFGWMNASFVVGRALLDARERAALAAREPVERVFGRALRTGPE